MGWSAGMVAIALLFCLAPLAAQAWSIWAAVFLLGWGWVEVWPAIGDGRASGAAVSYLALCTAAFGACAAGRAAGLALEDGGRSRRQVLWTDALGLAVPAGLLLWPGLL